MPYQWRRRGSLIPDPRDRLEHLEYLLNRTFPAPLEILERMRVIDVPFHGFDGMGHIGRIVVDHELVPAVRSVFTELHRAQFPIRSVTPISLFDWSDERSMRADNTSAFNYRYISGTMRLSLHAFGRAIDINPLENPHVIEGIPHPEGAGYQPRRRGTIVADSLVVRIFREHGFVWGGDWFNPDYQHFEAPL